MDIIFQSRRLAVERRDPVIHGPRSWDLEPVDRHNTCNSFASRGNLYRRDPDYWQPAYRLHGTVYPRRCCSETGGRSFALGGEDVLIRGCTLDYMRQC